MAPSGLDQLVKGAASPSVTIPDVKSRDSSPDDVFDAHGNKENTPSPIADPTTILPSSPPQIYLNLLILEASLRSQYLTLRARRRQNVLFLTLLAAWNAFFFYALFLQPREDGSGIGGSVYWAVETMEKVALMGGIVTAILVWGTGQWERGVRWPRRFVVGPWLKELWHHLLFLFPLSSYYASYGASYHYVEYPDERRHLHPKYREDHEHVREEDLSPGGDHVKLLLLPKPFSPDFRENWELYRSEYWEKENERRVSLLQRVRRQERQRAREQGGWFWWFGFGAPRPGNSQSRDHDVEKPLARQFIEKDSRRSSMRKEHHHLRTGSRSATSSTIDGDERPPSRGSRGQSALSESNRRSRALSGASKQSISRIGNSSAERGSSGHRTRSSAAFARASSISGSDSEQVK